MAPPTWVGRHVPSLLLLAGLAQLQVARGWVSISPTGDVSIRDHTEVRVPPPRPPMLQRRGRGPAKPAEGWISGRAEVLCSSTA